MRPINKIDYFVHVEERFDSATTRFQGSSAFIADSGASCSMLDYDLDPVGGEPPEPDYTKPEEELIFGFPAKYVYIGGGAIGFVLLCYLIGKTK